MTREPLGTIKLTINDRIYTVQIYTNDCSINQWLGIIIDDTDKCIGSIKQESVDKIKRSAINLVLQEF